MTPEDRARLVRIEEKLDAHLERLTRAEVHISWLRKVGAAGLTTLLAIVGKLIHLTLVKP